jgi:outer membrane protein OmpA-like peptidoglycan-associated protein
MKDQIVARLPMDRRTSLLNVMATVVAALALALPGTAAIAAEKSRLLTEVHFDTGSANITLGGQQKIEKAIAAIKKQNPREIHVIGFTDSTGDSALNLVISRDRANNVASVLSKNGITVPLVIEGKGENGAPYKIPDDMSEPLNRCVGIIAVGGTEKQPTL